MATKIFLTLPVRDLPASKAFFTALGYRFNNQFSDDTTACLVISDDIYAMLGTHEKFRQFSPHPICDATKYKEVLITLSCESRAHVDELADKAVAAGATVFEEPSDYGFMYARSFLDLDGHGWNMMYMDPSHVQPES
ncbi:VOC family protein [Limnoglobus roseus]|uniref:Glyoxalase/bleomycin resistance/extradiol dioxygenase family protein n=1 Tax=Limnoglobus roseus TaxID=2598579 RepID=A0A5C1A7D8_9BACT|nr:VOC family protein [Limnoglobus roseus]QEL15189.1 glyoxalase/bleomycin resistance/extradiol dioxygenase family protein [Limnoglobus roseus]